MRAASSTKSARGAIDEKGKRPDHANNVPLSGGGRFRAENLLTDTFAAGQWLKSILLTTLNSRDHIYTLSAGGTYWRYDDDDVATLAAHVLQGLDIFSMPRRMNLAAAQPLRGQRCLHGPER